MARHSDSSAWASRSGPTVATTILESGLTTRTSTTDRRGVAQGLRTPKSVFLIVAVCLLHATIGLGNKVRVGVLSGAEHVTSLVVLFAHTAVGAFAVARLQRAHGPQRLRTSDPLAPEPQGNVQQSRLNSGEAG